MPYRIMPTIRRAAAPALLALMLAATSSAQGSLPRRDQNYMRDTVNLAGTLGGAHAARVTCNGRSDQYWRKYMQELLGLEAPNRDALHRAMVQAFNNAFSRERAIHTVCNQEAVDAEAVYANEGRRIADRLAEYYFPSRRSGRVNRTIDPG